MPDEKTIVEEFEVKDLEDGSKLRIAVLACSELGNDGKPGLQVRYMGNIVNFETVTGERIDYQAKKAGGGAMLLESSSWVVHADQYVKVFYVPGTPPRARVEVKSRTSKPLTKEYDLPFSF